MILEIQLFVAAEHKDSSFHMESRKILFLEDLREPMKECSFPPSLQADSVKNQTGFARSDRESDSRRASRISGSPDFFLLHLSPLPPLPTYFYSVRPLPPPYSERAARSGTSGLEERPSRSLSDRYRTASASFKLVLLVISILQPRSL